MVQRSAVLIECRAVLMEGGGGPLRLLPVSELRSNERKGRVRELLATYYTEEAQGKGLEARCVACGPVASSTTLLARGGEGRGLVCACAIARGAPDVLLAAASRWSCGVVGREGSVDPCDLDGAAFDVEHYMEEQMQGERMKQLLKNASKIRGEVKTLDNDMQMLVYENYTKFISATDTIGQMKEGVESMEDEMQSLAATITKISDGSTRINTNLSEHRAKIDKLAGVRRLLTKLQFLMELPARLRQCVVEERFSDAIRYYEGTKAVLERFKATEGFGHLDVQIEESMDEIRAKLQARLCDPLGKVATVREARDLLLELGRSEDECMEEVDAAARGSLHRLLEDGRGKCSKPPIDDLYRCEDLVSLPPFSDELGSEFVYTWLRYVTLFDALFVQGQEEDVQGARRARLAGNARGPMAQYFDQVASHLVPGAAAVELSDASPSWSRTPKPPELATLVFKLQGFGSTVATAERVLPGEGLLDAGGSALVRTVEGTAASCFATCRKCVVGVTEHVRRVCSAPPSEDTEDDQARLVSDAANDLRRCADDCLNELKCLASVKGLGVPDGFEAKVVEAVHVAAGEFLAVLGEELYAMSSEFASNYAELDAVHVNLDSVAAMRSLCAAALCNAAVATEHGLISAVAGNLEEYFGAGSHPMYHGSMLGYSIPVQTERMQKQRAACLEIFVIRGAATLLGSPPATDEDGDDGQAPDGGLAAAFHCGCAVFQNDGPPSAVRSATVAAWERVAAFAATVARICGEAGRPAAVASTMSEEDIKATATMQLMSDICAAAASESDGVAVSAPSPLVISSAMDDEASCAGVLLQTVLCSAAKALVEELRLSTLSEGGYQQVRLDLAYIMVSAELVYGLEGDSLHACLHGLCDAASERCSSGRAQPLAVVDAAALISSHWRSAEAAAAGR